MHTHNCSLALRGSKCMQPHVFIKECVTNQMKCSLLTWPLPTAAVTSSHISSVIRKMLTSSEIFRNTWGLRFHFLSLSSFGSDIRRLLTEPVRLYPSSPRLSSVSSSSDTAGAAAALSFCVERPLCLGQVISQSSKTNSLTFVLPVSSHPQRRMWKLHIFNQGCDQSSSKWLPLHVYTNVSAVKDLRDQVLCFFTLRSQTVMTSAVDGHLRDYSGCSLHQDPALSSQAKWAWLLGGGWFVIGCPAPEQSPPLLWTKETSKV